LLLKMIFKIKTPIINIHIIFKILDPLNKEDPYPKRICITININLLFRINFIKLFIY
jgi:hypothetical protein